MSTLADETTMLPYNNANQWPSDLEPHCRRTETSTTLVQMP